MRENRGGVRIGVVWMSAIVLAVGVLFTSIAGQAQTPQAQPPQATVRELATIEVDAKGEARVIKILSTVGDFTRTLRLPFSGAN